jgi:hypothetical protein
MSEHRINPRAVARSNGAPAPQGPLPAEALQAQLTVQKVPKPHVHVVPKDSIVEQDGVRYLIGEAGALMAVPEGHVLVAIGDAEDESLTDIVVGVACIYAEPANTSIIGANGQRQVKAAGIFLRELARVDYREFRKRGQAIIAGALNVPGFNEVEGAWQIPAGPTSS